MRKNQKGFTLVELIIAIAILAIVTLAICGFIVVGSRSYTSANTDIMLQQDAQLAFNQISDVIIDTTDSISYGVRSGGAGDMQLVLKDSEYAGEADEKCLIVVNKQEAGSLNDNKSYWFYWNKEREIIYFNEVEASSDMSEADIRTAFEAAADMSNVSILAQHVQEFSVDISQFEENRVVMLSAVFANGNREYVTSNNVTVRNRIALNQITIDPMTRATEFTINVVNNIILEPGDFFPLSTIVDVQTPSSDKELKWELVSGAQNGTSIVESSGDLRLGIEETRTNFTVKVSRANEEYTGQNERVSKTIIVNVKRATAVNISGPATAKQGDTLNLTGAASGNQLGVACTAHPGDDTTKDWDLITSGEYSWKIIEGSQYGQITNPKVGSAVLTINSDATPGAKIRVQAASQLSATKGYGNLSTPAVPPVTGIYEVVIEKSQDSSALPLGSDLIYGSDNSGTNMHYDYIRKSFPDGLEYTKVGKYVFCIRVREENDPNWHSPEDDWYLVYLTSAANMRFAPDLFGLDMTKSYKVYLQALIPMPKTTFDDLNAFNEKMKSGQWWDSYDDIWNEYSANLNGEGKYTGNVYYATELYYAELNPPSIQLDFENKTYPYEDKSYQEVINLLGNARGLGRPSLNKNGTINIDANIILNNLAYTIYKEDESGNWNRIYGPTYDNTGSVTQRSGLEKIGNTGLNATQNGAELSYPSTSYSGDDNLGTHQLQPTASTFLNYNNPNGDKSKAIGKYHIVPGYLYANNPVIRKGEYDNSEIIRKKTDNYWDLYYYKEWDCVINFEITMELSLELIYEGKQNSEEYINFPLPTDSNFPFGGSGELSNQYYTVYSKNGDYVKNMSGVTVTCTNDNGKYTITLSSAENKSKARVTTDYGIYRWEPGYTKWECVNRGAGPYVKPGDSWWGTCIEFTLNGQKYKMEIPLPGTNGFPTSGKGTWNLSGNNLYRADDLAGESPSWTNVQGFYEFNGTTCTITVKEPWDYGANYGTWTWTPGQTEWKKK